MIEYKKRFRSRFDIFATFPSTLERKQNSVFFLWFAYHSYIMASIWISVFACFFVAQIQAQIITPGSCKKVETKKDFDLSKYMGRWFGIEKYPNSFAKGSCNRAEYKLKPEGGVAVNNSEVLDNGKISFAIGSARQDPSSSIASHLQVRFSDYQPWILSAPYFVLDTDYETFTVVYSCSNQLLTRKEFLWIMSRERTLSAENYQHIYEMLENYGIDTSNLETTNQDPTLCAILQ